MMNNTYLQEEDPYYQKLVTQELGKFNWGAFGLTWVWGLFNEVSSDFWKVFFITQFAGIAGGFFVGPLSGLVSLAGSIYIGMKGNEWAWFGHKNWGTIDHFSEVQKKWAIGFLVYFLFSGPLMFAAMLGIGGLASKEIMQDMPIEYTETAIERLVLAPEYKDLKTSQDIAKYYSEHAGEECESPKLLEDGVTVSCNYVDEDMNLLMKFNKLEVCSLDKYSCNVIVTIKNRNKNKIIPVKKLYFDDNGKTKKMSLPKKL